jgi:hypothetical protein
VNRSKPLSSASRIISALSLRARSYLPRQRSVTFGGDSDAPRSGIGPIFVINLDRQIRRWTDMVRELGRILDRPWQAAFRARCSNTPHATRRQIRQNFSTALLVQPFYTLGDQLFVEPQPQAVPDVFELERPI